MSEPIRYTGKTEGSLLGSPHWEHPKGEWVKWEEYARINERWEFIHRLDSIAIKKQKEEIDRLKAEVERLEKTEEYLQNTLNQYALDDMRLQAEVERLTKYGDVLESGLRTLPGDFPRCLANEWRAAKEGKQS